MFFYLINRPINGAAVKLYRQTKRNIELVWNRWKGLDWDGQGDVRELVPPKQADNPLLVGDVWFYSLDHPLLMTGG